ncbi:MAG TPA: hypothetical protein VGF06_15335, partial [Terriglobales bacterium]
MKDRLFVFVVCLCGLFVAPAFGQYRYDNPVTDHLTFSVGGGPSMPTDEAGRDLNTGWNIDING